MGGEEENCGKPLHFCMCGLRTKPVSVLSVSVMGLLQVAKVGRISKATRLAEGQKLDWNIGTIQLFMTPCSSHIKLNLILMDSFIRETCITRLIIGFSHIFFYHLLDVPSQHG